MLFSSVLAAAVALLGPALTDASPNPVPDNVATFAVGDPECYNSLYGFTKAFNQKYQAASACATHCVPLGKPVMAINNTDCWCSDKLPPAKNKVDLSKCSLTCPGFGDAKCM